MPKTMSVYLMARERRVLYTGVTNDLVRRVWEHRSNEVPGFAGKYRVFRLVYFEDWSSPQKAILREKQIKGWRRSKKVALIESMNPDWEDLAKGWFGQ